MLKYKKMEKIKKLNLKKQLVSLKFCHEEQQLETKALISRIHNLENIFKITKQFIKEKKTNNFDFKNEKRYLLIKSQKKTLLKNIDKQRKIFSKSILLNKYQELQQQKESLIQTIEEKKNILNSIKNELSVYKMCQPYGSQISTVFLDNILDSSLTNNNLKIKYNNIISNNIDIDDNTKKRLKKIIFKEKLRLQKKSEDTYDKLKHLYYYFMNKYQKMTKEQGFSTCFINNKYNKIYSFTVEQVKNGNNNSSDDSNSDSNSNSENRNKINKVLDSINEHIFEDENNKQKLNKTITNYNIDKFKIINKNNTLHNISLANAFEKEKKSNMLEKIFSPNKNELNFSRNYERDKIGLVTEINNGRNGELNRKLLKIKECYYECLDRRYELKNALKENISQIYNIKEKIKKNKRENNQENSYI